MKGILGHGQWGYHLEDALPTPQAPQKQIRAESLKLHPSSLNLVYDLFTQVVLPPLGISFSICTMGPTFVLTEDSCCWGALNKTMSFPSTQKNSSASQCREVKENIDPHVIRHTGSCSGPCPYWALSPSHDHLNDPKRDFSAAFSGLKCILGLVDILTEFL